MQPEFLAISIAAGFLSGIINTLAGSGSVFTLPVLLYLGLPAHIANGTNRVGITCSNICWRLDALCERRTEIQK